MHRDDFGPPSFGLLETRDAYAPGSTYSGLCVLGWSTHLPNGLAGNELVSNFYLLCDELTVRSQGHRLLFLDFCILRFGARAALRPILPPDYCCFSTPMPGDPFWLIVKHPEAI